MYRDKILTYRPASILVKVSVTKAYSDFFDNIRLPKHPRRCETAAEEEVMELRQSV